MHEWCLGGLRLVHVIAMSAESAHPPRHFLACYPSSLSPALFPIHCYLNKGKDAR